MAIKDTHIRNAKPKDKPYKIYDGSGTSLYCLVMPNGSKYWRFDYVFNGKRKTLSLGTYPETTLEEARNKVLELRKLVKDGIDPSAKRKAERSGSTFQDVAKEWLATKRNSWTPKHAQKVVSILERHIFPCLGNKNIKDVTPQDVIACLNPIQEAGKLETAHKALEITGQVCRYAIIQGKIQYDPCYPLKEFLPPVRNKHFPAPESPEDFARIIRLIWTYPNLIVASALKILAYTFQRPGEVRSMRWEDIDFEAKEWRFVVSKTGTPHIVPLSRQVIEILKTLEPFTRSLSPYVFPSLRTLQRPISDMAMNAALKSLGIDTKNELTGHGFRAVARTLLHERLGFPPDVIEHQLAHKVPDRLGKAYNRTRFLDQRREMMQAWADYIDSLISNGNAV